MVEEIKGGWEIIEKQVGKSRAEVVVPLRER